MIETTTQTDFESHLEQHPDDWSIRLVYADWLDELGDEIRANGQRWQVEHKCQPFIHGGSAAWFDGYSFRMASRVIQDHRGNLPSGFLSQMSSSDSAFYDSLELAETALAKAIHELNIVSSCNFIRSIK